MIREPKKVSSASIQTLKSDQVVFELKCFREFLLNSADKTVLRFLGPVLDQIEDDSSVGGGVRPSIFQKVTPSRGRRSEKTEVQRY